MFLQDPHLASFSAYTVVVRLRLWIFPPLWHRKDMSRLVDGKKRSIGINVKCSINFNGRYRCAELQRKPFYHNQVKIQPCNFPLPVILLTVRWALRWLQ